MTIQRAAGIRPGDQLLLVAMPQRLVVVLVPPAVLRESLPFIGEALVPRP
ncbi:hypothetical protein [Nocardia puris]